MNKATIDRELLPCPFCGSNECSPNYNEHRMWVDCDNCGAKGQTVSSPSVREERGASEAKAIRLWNTRAILAAPRQPEGEGLVIRALEHNGITVSYRLASPHELRNGEPLCRLSDAQRAIAELREERDTLRQQLAERDAQIASMRAEVTPFIETHWMPVARQRDKLAGLLVQAQGMVNGATDEWHDAARAALAEVKPCAESPNPAAT